MASIPTPVFIPGLVLTPDLFTEQLRDLDYPVTPQMAVTTGRDSITAMAEAALALAEGPLVPVGLSMGGYIALEMARLAPDRVAGIALLNTAYREDTPEKREQREATIKMAESDRFRGVTRHLMKSFLSPAALADETLVARIIAMAEAVGRENFVLQQRAILGRRDQSDTLRGLTVPALILCGSLDTLTPPQISREMADLARQSELVILEGIGHLSPLETPDEVTAILNRFLARFAG